MNNPAQRLLIALDLPDPGRARELVAQLSPLGIGFKVGLELFMAGGPDLVAELADRCRLFLDLKFHDIPSTVAAAVRRASGLGIWMLNIHAAGGREMMIAAREALENCSPRPILLGVTVLTSMSGQSMAETGCPGSAEKRVALLSRLSAECGLDGVICSPLEIARVKESVSPDFITVTPGIRPGGAANDDQSRVAAPGEAIRAGGDYLVVGRPVTRADDPFEAVRKIIAEMEAVQ
jgi:orotidine-5'-phosphate decarboxylase